jgi:formamidopyrimidine-DNA glycosylase
MLIVRRAFLRRLICAGLRNLRMVFALVCYTADMPELPEAQTIATALDLALRGGVIRKVILRRRDFLKTGRAEDLQALAGQTIRSVTRRGKAVVIDLGKQRLVLQLGMSGRAYVQELPFHPSPLEGEGRVRGRHAGKTPLPPHTHLVLELEGGREFRYANVRRIAAGVHVLDAGQLGPLAHLGPDANAISRKDFLARLHSRRRAGRSAMIKSALLNQSILAGVGNIYADEALFRAGIRPTRRVQSITLDEMVRLHRSVRAVLRQAIAAGGSTLKTSTPFAGVGGELGRFTFRHAAYGRYGQPCLHCGTTLLRKTIGGRTSTFCPRCQK